jgi:hypothetical protein
MNLEGQGGSFGVWTPQIDSVQSYGNEGMCILSVVSSCVRPTMSGFAQQDETVKQSQFRDLHDQQ